MNGSPRNSRLSDLLFDDYKKKKKVGILSTNAASQERQDQILAVFSEIDANGDKLLSFEELFNFLNQKSDGKFSQTLCQEIFDRMDRDLNSEVTSMEFASNYIEIEEFIKQKIEELKKVILDNKLQTDEYKKRLIKSRIENEPVGDDEIMEDSSLVVKVIEVINIKNAEIYPFVELICNRQIIETQHELPSTEVVYNETFTFKIDKKGEELKVLLKDYKNSKKSVGEGKYSLSKLTDQMKKDIIVDLFNKDTRLVGKAHLELQWIYNKQKYYKDIISQLNIELENNEDMKNTYENTLNTLGLPFKVDNDGYNKNDKKIEKMIENVAYGIMGNEIKWTIYMKNFLAIYVIAAVLQMYLIPNFLNVNGI